jgi:hypothetical protein
MTLVLLGGIIAALAALGVGQLFTGNVRVPEPVVSSASDNKQHVAKFPVRKQDPVPSCGMTTEGNRPLRITD